MAKCQVIINRQKAAFNRKHTHMPEEATISIHTGSTIEYAYAIELTGAWILKQDYANSPCSGAHIWLEGDRDDLEITHTQPLSNTSDSSNDDADSPVEAPKTVLDYF